MRDTITDAEIVSAIRDGARIHNLSDRLGLDGSHRPWLRRRLQRLEREGKVHRNGGYQACNSYFWQRCD